jgi:hypothetical protein
VLAHATASSNRERPHEEHRAEVVQEANEPCERSANIRDEYGIDDLGGDLRLRLLA